MKYGNLVLEKHDFLVTRKFMEVNLALEDYSHKDILEILDSNLDNAIVVDVDQMPSDIVRLYSNVTVQYSSGWQETLQLVSPGEIDPKENKISVVSSLGASLIGLSQGDTFIHGLPGNAMLLKLIKVEQTGKKTILDISEKEFRKLIKWDSDSLMAKVQES
ncbi:GreA/GreB family elongation factor [Flagellimonas sp.]|uniref:GreA/GreB family elongation factor n=1 Tax=Flagellimonas sp. TaxID=2058762 RepID=UPI003AB394C9